MTYHESYDNVVILTIFIVLHVSIGTFLWRVYPNERIDNFFIYEQFLITVIWLVLSFHLIFFEGMYNGNIYHILTFARQVSGWVQIIFELTLPLYVIQRYGYPDAPKQNDSSSDTILSSDRVNQSIAESSKSKTTGESLNYTIRSQLGIDEIMGDKNFRDLFSSYLGREFQMEAFLFFDALQYHKDVFEENANSIHFLTKEDAQRIIDEFIVEDAVNKLPISDRLCKQIIEDFSKVDDENPVNLASIFEPAINNLKTRLSLVLYKYNMNV